MKLKDKKIAVLLGGTSREKEVSLRSGKKVFESLKSQGFKVITIDPAEGKLIKKLQKAKIDLVCIMLHGKPGEDGTIQGLLESYGFPYTGSKVLASALAMDKVASKRIWEAVGIPTPEYKVINSRHDIRVEIENLRKTFPLPFVVKPVSEGSSIGVTILKSGESEKKVTKVISKTVKEFKDVFIEEFIDGREVTVGILGTYENTKALPILELAPKTEFYDYKAKYTKGMTDFIIPARLSKPLYAQTQKIALAAHHCLNCHGFSRVDIIVSRDGIPYVHDVNTIPGMTDLSDLPAQAAHAGISYDELVVKILESAVA